MKCQANGRLSTAQEVIEADYIHTDINVPENTNRKRFIIFTDTNGKPSDNKVYYDNGSGVGMAILLKPRLITVESSN